MSDEVPIVEFALPVSRFGAGMVAVQYKDLTALRARIAELEGRVKMAYFEGHADAKCDSISAADDWKGSEARTALEGRE